MNIKKSATIIGSGFFLLDQFLKHLAVGSWSEKILLNEFFYKRGEPARGDIVVFKSPSDEKKYFISVMKDVRQNEQGGIEIDRTINTIAVDFIKKYKKAMSEASTDVQNKLVELEQEVNKKSEEGKVIDIAALFNDIYQLEKSTMEEMAAAKDANVKNSILRKVSQESELAA